MAVCWIILMGQQMYTVIQHSLLYIVAKSHLFSVVTWKDMIKYLQKSEGCTDFCVILYTKLRLNHCHCVTWTISTMSSLPFWALSMVVTLLFMQGQKVLISHKKYLDLYSEDEQRSYGFGTTWGWVINDSFHFWVNYPYKNHRRKTNWEDEKEKT